MKCSLFLFAISFFAFSVFITNGGRHTNFVRTGASGLSGESFTEADNPSGDVWVFDGAWCYWDGGGISFCEDIDLEELRRAFIEKSPYLSSGKALNADEPLSAIPDESGIYVLDSTPLYFGDVSLGDGDICGFAEINIMSGRIHARSLRAVSGIYISTGGEVYIDEDICSGGAFESFGGTINAGDLYADKIWLDSSDGPLQVAISGFVLTGYYTQEGGYVDIEGSLLSTAENIDGHASITVSGEYARNNTTVLNIGGDIICTGSGGDIVLGYPPGGMDETALTSFVSLRSNKKISVFSAYDSSAVLTSADGGIKISVSGNVKPCLR